MTSGDARSREETARDATRRVLEAADRASGDAALAELPLQAGDVTLIAMALGSERRDILAMMLGKASISMVQSGDAAAAVGVARALEAFWVGEGQPDHRYRPLARVEVGSVLMVQARGLERLGEVDRAVALVDAHPGLHDKSRHLSIIAAEALVRAEKMDPARAMLPPTRPERDIGEASDWDVVYNLLSDYGPDNGGVTKDESLKARWGAVIDKLVDLVKNMGQVAGIPAAISKMMLARLEQERTKTPTSETEFLRRNNSLSAAIDAGRR